ncbi:spore germination protein [Paenibacillus sp. UMB7766-LJ446]|uniref:spore germination protein n=1 Tax=Paenibacillus sp. UMB7766-LJ446 TaxID=3046313 RepID=UPI00255129BB|nr:spore germination protein [Paenibacillus sp. UMB7766-LJ446]MDK8192265.1 spore germination protein [Paenibacillus sp. UMB7766-LJ446]
MSGWKKFKKYVIADLSEGPNSDQTFSLGHWNTENKGEPSQPSSQDEHVEMPQAQPWSSDKKAPLLSLVMKENIDWLSKQFSYPQSSGLIFHPVAIGSQATEGMVIFMESQVDAKLLYETVIHPLLRANLSMDRPLEIETLRNEVLTNCKQNATSSLEHIVQDILKGSAIVMVNGLDQAVIVDVKDGNERGLESPKTENVILGSQVGFTENIQTNLSLIKRRLQSPDLMVESGVVGTISRTSISIVYLQSIANTALVNEVRRRIANIKMDYIGDSGMLEQLIEDRPNSIYPGMLSTERPDRAASQIVDGYVCILVDNSPFALIVPSQFPLFLQTAEDNNLRWQYSSFLRIIRLVGFFLSLYLPALFVAIANFHQEMIPTTLVLAIASTRESIPLPVAAEAFLLEAMFELIREAGVRIPSVIGPTIGIVGALILGQAAVQANIVSPIMVIITAATALASYTIPNYNMQFATRILRFVYLACASFMGLIGILLLSMILWTDWIATNRFGVPSLAPISPKHPGDNSLLRNPWHHQTRRPASLRPQKKNKMGEPEAITPSSPSGEEGGPS